MKNFKTILENFMVEVLSMPKFTKVIREGNSEIELTIKFTPIKTTPKEAPKEELKTTKVAGVSWDKKLKKWKVTFCKDHECIYLGRFKKLEDAIYVRYLAEQRYQKYAKRLNKKYIDTYDKSATKYIREPSKDRELF